MHRYVLSAIRKNFRDGSDTFEECIGDYVPGTRFNRYLLRFGRSLLERNIRLNFTSTRATISYMKYHEDNSVFFKILVYKQFYNSSL